MCGGSIAGRAAGCVEKCVRKQCPVYGEVAGCREAMLGVEEALLGMGEQLGVWRTNAGCVEKCVGKQC